MKSIMILLIIVMATGCNHESKEINSAELSAETEMLITAWGWNKNGQCDVPGEKQFIAVTAGIYHGFALKSNGTLVGWGGNEYGQLDFPAHEKVKTIACGLYHTIAIKTDGSLTGWGWNRDGQCEPPSGHDYIAISAGSNHSLALKSDGSLVAWGWNHDGQCNVPTGNNFRAVAAGAWHRLRHRGSSDRYWQKHRPDSARDPSGPPQGRDRRRNHGYRGGLPHLQRAAVGRARRGGASYCRGG